MWYIVYILQGYSTSNEVILWVPGEVTVVYMKNLTGTKTRRKAKRERNSWHVMRIESRAK